MGINGSTHKFTDDNINKAPDQSGVYELLGGNDTIYYGRSTGEKTSIRARLEDHKSGSEGSCTKNASHFRWEVTSSAVAREKELLDEYNRNHGKLPRCNERVG